MKNNNLIEDLWDLKQNIDSIVDLRFSLKNIYTREDIRKKRELKSKKNKLVADVKKFLILEIEDDIQEIKETEINSIETLKNRIRKLREFEQDINYIKKSTDEKLIDFFEVY